MNESTLIFLDGLYRTGETTIYEGSGFLKTFPMGAVEDLMNAGLVIYRESVAPNIELTEEGKRLARIRAVGKSNV